VLYSDYLAIKNFENNRFGIQDFYKIAKEYLDTLHTKKAVNNVTFFLQIADRNPVDSIIIDQERRNMIAAFTFDNWGNNLGAQKKHLTLLTLWHNGRPAFYFAKSPKQKISGIDSVLNANQLISNKF